MNISAIFSVFAAFAAGSGEIAPPAESRAAPVVVELFTSQSCSSCMAAAGYFEDLAARDNIVALSWHVDYWNALQTAHGQWVDPYSDAAHTQRQRRYNQSLRSTNAVYTPQIVINGASEATGSDRDKVEALVTSERDAPPTASIASMAREASGKLSFIVAGRGEVFAVYFKPASLTPVNRGENAGRKFKDTNIVTRFELLRPAPDGVFSVAAPSEGERCAVLVQAPDQGQILAAQYCAES